MMAGPVCDAQDIVTDYQSVDVIHRAPLAMADERAEYTAAHIEYGYISIGALRP